MTAVDHAELKRLAEGATTVRRDANGRLDGEDAIRLWVGFHDAMTPKVAIALLSEIEGWKEAYDRSTRLHSSTCRELIAAQSEIEGLKAERDARRDDA